MVRMDQREEETRETHVAPADSQPQPWPEFVPELEASDLLPPVLPLVLRLPVLVLVSIPPPPD
jgi:hypothetical protein